MFGLDGDNNGAGATQTMWAVSRAAYNAQQEIESELKRQPFGDLESFSGCWPVNKQNSKTGRVYWKLVLA